MTTDSPASTAGFWRRSRRNDEPGPFVDVPCTPEFPVCGKACSYLIFGNTVSVVSVTSIDRSFRILQEISEQPGSLTDLSRALDIPTSTMGRFLGSLQAAGAIQRESNGTYSIGPTIIRLAGGRTASPDLLTVAGAHISALAKLTNETAGIAASVDDDVLHLGQVSSDADVQVRDWTGEQVAAHHGCTGLVVMAYWPEAQIDRYLAQALESFNEHTVIDANVIRERLAHIRSAGYLWTTDEYARGVTSAAAPVRDSTGRAVGALHVFGPSYRFPNAEDIESLSAELCRRAEQISSVLRFHVQ